MGRPSTIELAKNGAKVLFWCKTIITITNKLFYEIKSTGQATCATIDGRIKPI